MGRYLSTLVCLAAAVSCRGADGDADASGSDTGSSQTGGTEGETTTAGDTTTTTTSEVTTTTVDPADPDGDGVDDPDDNCPETENPGQEDDDSDGVGNACDNCAELPNDDQADFDGDGTGDLCECNAFPDFCVDYMAGGYPCDGVDMLSEVKGGPLGGGWANDIWGWTDPELGNEVALVGMNNGVSFVDVSNPFCPVYLGRLPTQTESSVWRDLKVYQDHVFVVAEAEDHGMQVFDLTQFRTLTEPTEFTATAHYTGDGDQFVLGTAHNIAIDVTSGFAFVLSSNDCGGLHMVDIGDPVDPKFVGCWYDEGPIHDAHCTTYDGPDSEHVGKQLCVTADDNMRTVSFVDVTDKDAPVIIGKDRHPDIMYSHQGWLTEDHAYFLLGDEVDESQAGNNTRTFIYDVRDLDAPTPIGIYEGPTTATDHNLYVNGGLVYEANYRAGLRVLDLERVSEGVLTEVAYFDTEPDSDDPGTSGLWSVYPFFGSGTIVVSGPSLWVLRLVD